ncbi:MAG: YbaK/EbsC family protein [Oscillospiraceae bacterium]
MSFETVKEYFKNLGMEELVLHFDVSSATVELAAEAVGVEPAKIAKTMSFLVGGEPILIVTAGDTKIDNPKYKQQFHEKAKMIPYGEVEEYVGHAPGGVCPFVIKDGVKVYLDESLKRFDTVYPAAGSDNSAVKLTIKQLEDTSGYSEWIDVCKTAEPRQ